MATTTHNDLALQVLALEGRTDLAGQDVTDLSGAELRLTAQLFNPGVVGDSFKVVPDSGMLLNIGGIEAYDLAVLAGSASGQGSYLAAAPAGVQIAVPASEPSLDRTDEVWLVVLDDTYDSTGVTLPVIGYRKGDAGGGAPGADPTWKAALKLATITVRAGVSVIDSGDIVDNRTKAAPMAHSHDWSQITGKPTTFTPSAHGHSASDITSGTLADARIPALDAVKIQSGQFSPDRIPSLDASKITTGVLDAAVIPGLDASKITTGTLSTARIPGLDASKITTGTLNIARLPVGTSSSQVAAGNHDHARIAPHTGSPAQIFVSTSNPSGGSNGDIWLKV